MPDGPPRMKGASFDAVWELYSSEKFSLLKVGYKLNAKAVNPTSVERQNMKLALSVINPFVSNALATRGAATLLAFGLVGLPRPVAPRRSCDASGADVLGETSMASTAVSEVERVSEPDFVLEAVAAALGTAGTAVATGAVFCCCTGA
ncbi:hypothetical protein HPB48_014403 [Haemaphysalis longicornis]|uniref:Uncharacterized protein n=1 Tax=Haemaphysalis longicornis TaxID=44386 RepID=A0A9J6GPY0_HAELO|nr:hypothetical protein HPB48_014403 [Haemaphysalis longicornis]